MRACKIHAVQKVAITSSIAAVRGLRKVNWPIDKTFDESHWSDTSSENTEITTYEISKTLAEKVAWEFREALPEAERFDVITLNPALIMGPSNNTIDFSSGGIVRDMMASSGQVGRHRAGYVDVRDVAKAHLLAIKNDAAKNRRFILV